MFSACHRLAPLHGRVNVAVDSNHSTSGDGAQQRMNTSRAEEKGKREGERERERQWQTHTG